MMTNGYVTIFYPAEDGEGFKRRGCAEAWIYKESRIKNQGNGARRPDVFDVRIELGSIKGICAGDIICFEKCNDVPPLSKCSRIAAVRQNNYGSEPHWHLRAEYIYR